MGFFEQNPWLVLGAIAGISAFFGWLGGTLAHYGEKEELHRLD